MENKHGINPLEALQSREFTFLNRPSSSRLVIRYPKDYSPWPLKDDNFDLGETDLTINVLEDSLRQALKLKEPPHDTSTLQILQRIESRRPTFVEISDTDASAIMTKARGVFQADKIGLALQYLSVDKKRAALLSFPAIERDKITYRLLSADADTNDADAIEKAFQHLALPSEVQKVDSQIFVITEMIANSEIVSSISQAELDDWLARLGKACIEFPCDIGDVGDRPDFLRYKGALYWCDGNLMAATSIKPAEVDAELEKWKSKLQRFIK